MREKTGSVIIHVFGMLDEILTALVGATVTIRRRDEDEHSVLEKTTDKFGACRFDLPEGAYVAHAKFHLARRRRDDADVGGDDTDHHFTGRAGFHVCEGETRECSVEVDLAGCKLEIKVAEGKEFRRFPPDSPLQYGQPIYLKVHWGDYERTKTDLDARGAKTERLREEKGADVYSIVPRDSRVKIVLALSDANSEISPSADLRIAEFGRAVDGFLAVILPDINRIEGSISTSLKRSASFATDDIVIWSIIRRAHNAVSFDRYMDFMNWIFCGDSRGGHPEGSKDKLHFVSGRRFLPFTDTDAYRNIKAATEAFLMANSCVYDIERNEATYIADYVAIDPSDLLSHPGSFEQYAERDKILPYLAVIRAKLQDQKIKEEGIDKVDIGNPRGDRINACYGILREKLECPCLHELIWSYWNEEGMLVQTMNAITRRFQNIRGPLANDPLANLEIDPLRPLNNLIWGWVQDEQHRLSVVRRNYEYDHHYGLRLLGKAVDNMRTADSRSKFLEAFHTLLSILAAFYRRDDDTTMVADGFPVLNALKEAHLILTQGAHNQFGDLPTTARIEMLMLQWILARPEFREFIPTRIMVAYPEPWMDRVDAMKKLQGWTDTSILHFRNLAIFGEQIILGIRYGNWNSIFEPVYAVNWARYWRAQVQGYLHAYRAVTGVDLSVDVTNARIDSTMPSLHLVKRLSEQRERA